MEKFFVDKYSKPTFAKPDSIDPGFKNISTPEGKEYARRMHEYVYAGYCSDNIRPMYCGERPIEELRALAAGRHSLDKIRTLIDVKVGPKDGQGRRSKGSILNISWDPMKLYPKYAAIAASKIASFQFSPTVRSMDTADNYQRRLAMAKDKLLQRPEMQQMMAMTGVQVEGTVKGNPNAIDTVEQLGGYSLPTEIIYEDLLAAVMQSTDTEAVRSMEIEDEVNLNLRARKVRWDPIEKRPFVEYIDPAGIIIPNSKYQDFRDASLIGHIEKTNMHTIRNTYEMNEEELFEISRIWSAQRYNSRLRNSMPGFNDSGFRQEYYRQHGVHPWDEFSIATQTVCWIDYDIETYINRQRPDGIPVFDMVPNSTVLSQRDIDRGVYLTTVGKQVIYESTWIIGTKYVLEFKKSPYIVRTGPTGAKRAELPYMLWRGNGASITERCAQHIYQLEVYRAKLAMVLSNLPPGPRYAIDLATLSDSVRLGQDDYDMMELLGIFQARGTFFYSSAQEFAKNPAYHNKSAITPLDANVMQDVQAFVLQMDREIENIRQVTGINEMADGSGDPERVLNGVKDSMIQASNYSLEEHVRGEKSVFHRTCKYIVSDTSNRLRDGSINLRFQPVDSAVAKVIDILPEHVIEDFTIGVLPLPTSEQIAKMEALVTNASMQKEVSSADLIVIMNLLHKGQLKTAQYYYVEAVAKAKAEEHARQIELMQAQAKSQQDAQIAVEQEKQKTMSVKYGYEMELLRMQLGAKANEEDAARGHAKDMESAGMVERIAQNQNNQGPTTQ